MKALLLMSIVLATFLLPLRVGTSERPRAALRSLILLMAIMELGYAFFLFFVFHRLH